jgi:hypothetical protein
VEVVEYESEEEPEPARPAPKPELLLTSDNILQHLLTHRMRQRAQREEMYKSFVSQF